MHIPRYGSRPRSGVRAAVAAAAVVVMTLALAAPSAAAQSQGSQDLGVDEISHSKNFRQVANIPKQAPLDENFNSDIAFKGNYAFQGNYDGFTIYNIKHPKKPQVVTQVHCPGGQGDVSVSERGDLLFMSVDYARTDDSCNSESDSPTNEDSWQGMRVFDISDLRDPS